MNTICVSTMSIIPRLKMFLNDLILSVTVLVFNSLFFFSLVRVPILLLSTASYGPIFQTVLRSENYDLRTSSQIGAALIFRALSSLEFTPISRR